MLFGSLNFRFSNVDFLFLRALLMPDFLNRINCGGFLRRMAGLVVATEGTAEGIEGTVTLVSFAVS
jgi:hypothetical protein